MCNLNYILFTILIPFFARLLFHLCAKKNLVQTTEKWIKKNQKRTIKSRRQDEEKRIELCKWIQFKYKMTVIQVIVWQVVEISYIVARSSSLDTTFYSSFNFFFHRF